MQTLLECNSQFRVIGLSASPGSSSDVIVYKANLR